MSSRETLRFVNGEDAVARLDAQRTARAERAKKVQIERINMLGGMMNKGEIVIPPEVAQEVQVQAWENTGEIPVISEQ